MSRLDDATVDEVRALLQDLRCASEDGRMLSDRYADILRSAVDEYCREFDKRAEALLRKLDEAA